MEEENQNVNPISNRQTNTSNFNVSSGGNSKKKGKKKIVLIMIAILLLIAIIAGLVYYFIIYIKPERVYKKLIEETIDSYTNDLKDMEYKTSKTVLKLDADLDTDEVDEKVKDLINKINLGMEVQTNNEEKQLLMNLKAKYEEEDLLDFQMYSDVNREKTYMELKNLLNKYIEVEEVDDEYYDILEEALENQKMTVSQRTSLQKAMRILKKELTNVIKEEYCSNEKEEIKINDKTVNTTKNTIEMSAKQLKEEFITVCENLRNNKEFMNCFEEKNEVSGILENLIEQLEEIDEDEETMLEMAIYTEGFMQKIVKYTLAITSQESNKTITIAFTKTAENTYTFEVLTDDDVTCTGTIKVEEKNKNEGTIQLEFDVPDFGKVKLNIEYSQKFNEDIDKVNVKNSVKADELTSDDQETLATNLQKSKLYELMESFSNLTGNTTIDYDNDDNDNYDDNTTSSKTNENEILSYDNNTKITFKMPENYKSRYVSDNYKTLERDDITIRISTLYGNKDEYYEELKDNMEYHKEESNNKNVQLSDVQTMEVNGRTYYYATFSYEYSSVGHTTKYETKYIWSEATDELVVDFEIRGAEDITTEELNEILTIKVENNR